jgi:beta-hydroxylase
MLDEIRAARRRTVKKSGRRLLHSLAEFIGRQSLIGDQPVFDSGIFPWLKSLEENSSAIRGELDEVLTTLARLPAFHQLSPDQTRISQGENWKTFVFYVFGDRFEPNCRRCPATAALLGGVPGLRNAWFSILAPRYHIPPHRGPTKGVVRIHLPLKIPADRDNCWLRVGERVLHWEEGRCLVFDDYYEHEVLNDTDEQRVVLFFDVDRPMRLPGKLVNRLLIEGIKHSAYVQDAQRNLWRWEQDHESGTKSN